MQLIEQFPLPGIGKQERRKLFGKHVQRSDRVPRLGGHFVLRRARLRDVADVGFGQEADFVVVVKHHAPVTGDAEVFQQHVAGKNIRRRQLLDRQTVIFQRFAHLRVVGVFQIQVERSHPPLGPAVADQHGFAFDRNRRRRHL